MDAFVIKLREFEEGFGSLGQVSMERTLSGAEPNPMGEIEMTELGTMRLC